VRVLHPDLSKFVVPVGDNADARSCFAVTPELRPCEREAAELLIGHRHDSAATLAAFRVPPLDVLI